MHSYNFPHWTKTCEKHWTWCSVHTSSCRCTFAAIIPYNTDTSGTTGTECWYRLSREVSFLRQKHKQLICHLKKLEILGPQVSLLRLSCSFIFQHPLCWQWLYRKRSLRWSFMEIKLYVESCFLKYWEKRSANLGNHCPSPFHHPCKLWKTIYLILDYLWYSVKRKSCFFTYANAPKQDYDI